MRVILASQSPARARVLRQAGLEPEIIVSNFDESTVVNSDPKALCAELARGKCLDVAARVKDDNVIIIAADTLLEFEGKTRGKPGTAENAIRMWQRMRGEDGIIHTGHHVFVRKNGDEQQQNRVLSANVHFADLSDEEICAYVATGEPIEVAGGFSVHKLAGAFITRIEGDPYTVVGVSLPAIRQMVIDLDVKWHELWVTTQA